MKKIILILAIPGIAAAVLGCILGGATRLFAQGSAVEGSGNIITQTRPAPRGIHRVVSARGVRVLIAEAAGDELRIEADDNLIDRVVTETQNGELRVTIAPEIKSMKNIHVTVTVPADGPFDLLEASSGSKIETCGLLETDRLEARASGGSNLDLKLKVQGPCKLKASGGSFIEAEATAATCTVEASSGSQIELEGSAAECTGATSSGAMLAAKNFEVADYRMKASSGSSARIFCTGHLEAHASSGASIRYRGDCTADITRSSGGSVARN